ncbi:MAG: DUF2075 domain-containing protein [Verrucomicrobia bacterium]|jgi:hypothetical protein|nr:DUF2075 domain-containing protein [Verrucomicrobiota bacterium]MBT7067473.1 DUF2075 domain-containing protein [Verrucomicrobiota bacterium]
MERAYYSDTVAAFLAADPYAIAGHLNTKAEGAVEEAQKHAWDQQVKQLKEALSLGENIESFRDAKIYFEFAIPRMGKRIDVVLVSGGVIFVIEFKVGSATFDAFAIDQVWDYALDLKNFHESSHHRVVAPVLVATDANPLAIHISATPQEDQLLYPIKCNTQQLGEVVRETLSFAGGVAIAPDGWEAGRYCPTPTVIEAALALYRGHSVSEISRSDAGALNLHQTTEAISEVIEEARAQKHKAICFVTGVPGAGKTLIGLNIATKHMAADSGNYSVFLSGNGPLVKVLQEALARDLVARRKKDGKKLTKKRAHSEVKAFVQNVHHYRDECLKDAGPPIDNVALFDEAQRAWDKPQTVKFMKQKKGIPDFDMSEPEFLISCIERHEDWGVIVCLVGGGQEINTGEAGIGEWVDSLNRSFPDWHIHISPRLTDSEYEAGAVLERIATRPNVYYRDDLHLAVSMRSFRAENVSLLVKQLLDLDQESAHATLATITEQYPIVITRNVATAKQWLKDQARGSERYGIVVSSQAERLKPHAIDVKSPMNPIHWFLNGKNDVRSSYYLESVATEFHVQGLELDWACVTWDGDFRYAPSGWKHHSFRGTKWTTIRKEERKTYLKNAYRVLLTRARQGMVIVVPPGDSSDPTRSPEFYDPTYSYLKSIGFPELD